MAWISKRELKIYLFIVGALTLVAMLITLISLLPGYIRYNKSIIKNELSLEKTIDISKFQIPPLELS